MSELFHQLSEEDQREQEFVAQAEEVGRKLWGVVTLEGTTGTRIKNCMCAR